MNVIVKLLGVCVSIGAGIVANKLLEAVWEKSTGRAAPKDGTDLDDALPGVLLFALTSASVGALVHVLTQRGAKKALVRLGQTPGEV